MAVDDVLARRPAAAPPQVAADAGLWVEHRGSRFVGVVEQYEHGHVAIRDDAGLRRLFPLDPGGFRLVETGAVVTLVRPHQPAQPQRPAFTASGAVAASPQPARVARADRILVEGTHDAELIEKVWGDELRGEGIVVEPIGGADHLTEEVRRRRPGPDARLGILLDHLVEGSKESRIAATIDHPHVLVTGHEFVDVWQAIRPHVVGLDRWPVVPPGRPWKDGICAALGAEEPTLLWRRIRNAVTDYRDLEPSFVGAVEQLLDFLLTPAA